MGSGDSLIGRFDAATAVQQTAEPDNSGWKAEIHDGWDIGGNANGGYLLALASRGMQAHAGRSDPATITAHYLRPGKPGAVTIVPETIKTGRRFTTVSADLLDDEQRPILRLLGAFTDIEPTGENRPPERVDEQPVELPPPDECVPTNGDEFSPALMQRVDLRIHPDDAKFRTAPSGEMVVRGWFRLVNDEPMDTTALLLAVDAFPPTVFNSGLPAAWVPTVELTAHIRNRPVPGWLRCSFSTRFVTGGYLEEDALIWDEAGTLVAQARQLALLPRPPT